VFHVSLARGDLTDVLERIVSGQTKSHQLHELLAWNWKAARERAAAA
jgi:transposase